jgi:type IV pilus assembly protein PilF
MMLRSLVAPVLILVLGIGLTACSTTEKRELEANSAKLVGIHTQLAAGHLMRNQSEFALQEVNKALAINPDDSQANNIMALIQTRLRNDDRAEKYFRKAIDGDGDNSEAQNNFAVFLCEHGRVQEAVRHFDAALANPLYKSPEKANLNAGICLKQRPLAGVSATKYFRNALNVNPRSAMALYNMAVISFESGQPLAARGFIQRYFEASKDTPETLLLAVKIERALGARDAQAGYALRLRGKYPASDEARQLIKITGK